MSLLKLPFLLSAGVGAQLAYTPPNHPQKTEMISPSYLEAFLNSAAGTLSVTQTVIVWGAVLGETASIVLPIIPPSQLSRFAPVLLKALGGPDTTRITPLFVAGSTSIALGGYIRWQCYRTLGRFFTFQLSVRNDHRLVTGGPYSIVRHPSYTGMLCNFLGVALLYARPDSWLIRSGVLQNPVVKACVLFWVGFSMAITTGMFTRCPKEDKMMQNEFGDEWKGWARRVKYWMIPGIY